MLGNHCFFFFNKIFFVQVHVCVNTYLYAHTYTCTFEDQKTNFGREINSEYWLRLSGLVASIFTSWTLLLPLTVSSLSHVSETYMISLPCSSVRLQKNWKFYISFHFIPNFFNIFFFLLLIHFFISVFCG